MSDVAADSTTAPSGGAGEIIAAIHNLVDRLQTADLTKCSDAELVDIAAETERAIARIGFAGDRQIVEATDRGLPQKTGYRSIIQFMTHRLRIAEPMRRRNQMASTATFSDLTTGEPLSPQHPTLADAFADGRVGSAHVRAVIDVLDQIPHAVEHDVKVAAERQMTEIAVDHTPADITNLGARLLAHLDPDGTLTDDADRTRRRNLWLNRQRADGTAKITGNLTPELVARIAMMLAVWAKPGMNNPNDPESPCGAYEDADPAQVAAAADRDDRTPAQRNHDAFDALLKAVLEDGLLGETHRGLPVQLIVKADLSDLIREAGLATTATGTLLPISDVLALAADAQPHLAVFKDATAVPLYFGHGKRLATRDQRLVSFARPDGEVCSAPGCDQPATHVEMHHAERDWADGGFTDITDLAPACPKHNRMVSGRPGHFTTRMQRHGPDEGRCVWRLNSQPGAPPNPERINRRPDIPSRFARHLTQVRDEIHGPQTSGDETRPDDPRSGAPRPGDPHPDDLSLSLRRVIDYRPMINPESPHPHTDTRPQTSVEAHLEQILVRHRLHRNGAG